ncbi:cell division protein FtsZ [Altererythrobacter sp.]|uniref:cell division protein FtsZ n=1 Tax=Altererythrobacter sp. TaxID=1872480 RepID=UPI001B06FD15|nr:cell division protein FtsZ [Altererythrobacter sp.]MBO6945449.1 cell division protein FtsZ [Altererythrobacter sp.]
MSINIGPATSEDHRPRITVVGIGGAGGNAIANMIESEIEGVDFIVANTDAQALSMSKADAKIQLGPDITGGLGAGARPEVGKAAAEETVKEIEDALEGVNMVFIAAGMGGGTGTGAAPVIAEAARRKGVLTVGVVTKPFLFEGTRRMRAAEAGIEELQKHVDTLIVIPNQNLFLIAKAETTFKEAFELADEVLQQGVRSITDLMVMPGLINLDFADVRSVMSEMGKAMMGTGEAEGESRALDAAERAIANPLLDGVSMQGAKGVIISIIGGEDMKLLEVDEAANHIRELVDEDANIIWGSAFNPDLDGKIRVSVVATGIDQSAMPAKTESAPINLSASRPPKRPVIALSEEMAEPVEEVVVDEPLELAMEAPEEPAAEQESDFEAQDEPESEPMSETAGTEEDEPAVEPFDLSGMQVGDDMGESEEDDDVDGIVDPLAGMRNEENDPYADHQPLDLASGSEQVESEEEPAAEESGEGGRRRSLLGGGSGASSGSGASAGSGGGEAAPSSGGGSTLFERMANLSRGASSSDEDDEEEDDGDDDGSSLSIPRFLGRQNNQ